MYLISICDDDSAMRKFIHETVMATGIPCRIEEYSDGCRLLKEYSQCDILFLDIDMPGINGIDTAKRIRRTDKNVKIIYVTGYQDYIQRSFSIHPFSFLVKPVSKADIERQLKEAVTYGEEVRNEAVLHFHTCGGVEEFQISDIYYLEYLNRKIRMVTKRGEYFLRGRITDYVKELSQYGFACPHKSFTVNLFYVKAIKGYDIQMLNGDKIPLSQKRSAAFRSILGSVQAEYI